VRTPGGPGSPAVDPEGAITAAFGLGNARGPLRLAAEGWLGHNRVYRLDAAHGSFAVKHYGRPVDDETPPERGFAIELAAYDGGVPMPHPIATVDGQCWALIGQHWYRCHEWVDGTAKNNEDTSAADAEAMGRLVAHLHGLAIPAGELRPSPDWRLRLEALLSAGRARHAVWADQLAAGLDQLCAMTTPSVPPDELIGSHRDLNAHNVLFSASGLRLIDWDAAGPAWPRWERADFALRWAGRHGGSYDETAVGAFVRGYRDGGGTWDAADPDVLSAAPARFLPWVVENIEMAVNRPSDAQDEVTAILIDVALTAPREASARTAVLARCLEL
jgi:Ser/Thr protein kinase RdoA (MazF antagonist)